MSVRCTPAVEWKQDTGHALCAIKFMKSGRCAQGHDGCNCRGCQKWHVRWRVCQVPPSLYVGYVTHLRCIGRVLPVIQGGRRRVFPSVAGAAAERCACAHGDGSASVGLQDTVRLDQGRYRAGIAGARPRTAAVCAARAVRVCVSASGERGVVRAMHAVQAIAAVHGGAVRQVVQAQDVDVLFVTGIPGIITEGGAGDGIDARHTGCPCRLRPAQRFSSRTASCSTSRRALSGSVAGVDSATISTNTQPAGLAPRVRAVCSSCCRVE